MELAKLIDGLEVVRHDADPALEIGGLAYDSRSVSRGDLFFAVPGFKVDGHGFIGSAASAGAAAVITERWQEGAGLPQIQVPDVRRSMAAAAFIFFDNPSSRLETIGVTGTNGKTTTTFLIDSILTAGGRSTALIGGVVYRLPEGSSDAKRTTPEAIDMQRLLAQAAAQGAEAATMEVSSHGIELSRTECIEFDVAVFTNLTREHLDLHGDMEAYYRTKRRLFMHIGSTGCGVTGVRIAEPLPVVNLDDSYGRRLLDELGKRAVIYGLGTGADVSAEDVTFTEQGTGLKLITPAGTRRLELRLPGEFNLYNALAAASAATALGISLDAIEEGLSSFTGAPGRFEMIGTDAGFRVILDYAHNEDGLEKVLRTARQTSEGRLITVFGCPGERDRDKRSVMGRIAGELSDLSVLTTDDCYGEDPVEIMAEVESGLEASGSDYRLFEDRREAIDYALASASEKDTVIVAGKGHEKVQIMPDGPHDFSDHDVIMEVLDRLAEK